MKIDNQLTDETVLNEVGKRIRSIRLGQNLTQADMAEKAGLSKNTVERLENGDTTQLMSFIRICRSLGILDRFEVLLPEPVPSPMAQLRLHNNFRQRASNKRKKSSPASWTWKEDK